MEKDIYNTIGKNIKKYRISKGLKQHDLASKLYMSDSFIAKLESKTRQTISIDTLEQIAKALEVIPRTLTMNCGADVVRILTDLRAKHANMEDKEKLYWGIDGNKGKVSSMKELNIWDTLAVKKQTLKTSVESSCMILRIDDIVSGLKKKEKEKSSAAQQQEQVDQETFGDTRDG